MQPTTNSHISQTPGICGGRPCITGSRIRVADIYLAHEVQGLTADQIAAEFPPLTLSDIHAALAYYFDNKIELDAEMRSDEDFVSRLRRNAEPGVLRSKLSDMDASGDPFSS